MTSDSSESRVLVYSSPNAFGANVVKAMLAEEEIPSSVDNENSSSLGMSAVPCNVYVSVENESMARQLIAVHEAQHQQRLADEERGIDQSEEASTDLYEAETAEYEISDEGQR